MKLFHTPLFLGITESEFETMKELHSMRSSFFFKNGTIFHTGDLIHEIGIIESGSVNIENIDLLGNKSILSNISQGFLPKLMQSAMNRCWSMSLL